MRLLTCLRTTMLQSTRVRTWQLAAALAILQVLAPSAGAQAPCRTTRDLDFYGLQSSLHRFLSLDTPAWDSVRTRLGIPKPGSGTTYELVADSTVCLNASRATELHARGFNPDLPPRDWATQAIYVISIPGGGYAVSKCEDMYHSWKLMYILSPTFEIIYDTNY